MPDRRVDESKPPQTHSLDDIYLAIDRLGAGMGSTQRLPMSLGRAQDIMRDVAREMILLREETREWICTRCRLVYQNANSVMVCDHCGKALRPAVVIRHAALLDKLQEEQEHVQRLEESVVTLLDFYGTAEESS